MQSHRIAQTRLVQALSLSLCLAGGTLVLGVGCSDDKAQSNPGGDSSLDTSTIPSSDASIPDNLTATAACARYALAMCVRRADCEGVSSKDCYSNTDYCPDALFSDGSTFTPESAWACADAQLARSCQDVVTGVNPACVTPGTRRAGDPCIAGSQCASLACSGACGVCIERAKLGEGCSTLQPCTEGLVCSSGSCVEPNATLLAELLAKAPLPIGAECSGLSTCVEGSYCALADGATTGTCTQRLTESTFCLETAACTVGTYCSIRSMNCAALPTVGQACGNDRVLNVAMWCDATSYCSDETSQCTLLPAAESPCATNLQLNNVPALCDAASYCDSTLETPTCKALLTSGQTCTESEDACVPGLSCLCDDAGCTTRSCGVIREFGASCTAPGEHCLVKIGSCTDGVCVAAGSKNLFALTCGQ